MSITQEKLRDGKFIVWLPLQNGSFSDISGNDHTPTASGSGLVFNREGMEFTQSRYATIADSDDLSPGDGSTDQPFTIMCWVKMYGTVDTNPIFFKSATNSWIDWDYRFGTINNGRFVFYMASSPGNSIGRFTTSYLTGYENQWIHLAATYDGSKTPGGIKLYINGAGVADQQFVSGSYAGLPNTTKDVLVGKFYAVTLDGTLKHMMMLNEESTETEINQIMDETANMKYPTKQNAVTKSLDLKELDSSGIHASYDMNTAGDQVIDSANGFDGTILNATKMNTPFGKGVIFDGVQSTIELPSLGYNTNDSFTVSGWVKTFDATKDQVLFNFGYDYTNNTGVAVELHATGNVIRCYNHALGSISTSFDFVAGVWYNLTITNNGPTGAFKFYVNGEYIGSYDFTGIPFQDRYLIGAHNVGFFKIVDGIIGPCQYWTRTLSQTEVENLYKKGTHLTYKTDWAISHSDVGVTEKLENSNWNIHSGTAEVISDEINGEEVKVVEASGSTLKIDLPLDAFMNQGSRCYGTWEFWMKHGVSDTWAIYISENLLDYPNLIGYRFGWWGSNYFFLTKSDGAIAQDIFASNETAPDNTWYKVKVTRGVNGEFNFYINDTLLTAFSGSMPVTDTTYATAQYFKFNMTTGVKLSWADKRGNYSFKKYEGVV